MGNSPVTGEFPAQRPVTQIIDVFFVLCPNKRLSKQWWGWWFEMQSSPLWRHHADFESSHNQETFEDPPPADFNYGGQMSFRDLTTLQRTKVVAPAVATCYIVPRGPICLYFMSEKLDLSSNISHCCLDTISFVLIRAIRKFVFMSSVPVVLFELPSPLRGTDRKYVHGWEILFIPSLHAMAFICFLCQHASTVDGRILVQL